ncbi:MAG TPA: hypothetical protein VKX17_25535 [Planctomycetota bacterium]|nr:hypothetical protein [Planctomycetota bacterium]
MKTITAPRTAMFTALALGLALSLGAATASEHGHFGHGGGIFIGVGIGHGGYGYGGGDCGRVWVDGYYEMVLQRVVVCPEHIERRQIEPVYQTNPGTTVPVLVKEGRVEEILVPAVFEDRYVRVWRPGFYRD